MSDSAARRGVWRWLVGPSDAVQEPDDRRTARLLSSILLALASLLTAGALASAFASSRPANSIPIWIAVVATVVAYGVSRTRRFRVGAWIASGALTALPVAMVLVKGAGGSAVGAAFIWSVLTLLISSLFLPLAGTLALAVVHIASLLGFVVLRADVRFVSVLGPLGFVSSAAVFILIAARHRELVERDRRSRLLEANRELSAIRASLEQRVSERTRDLERRADYMEATAAIARDATALLNTGELLRRVVKLITERLGFYHAGVFLLDADREWAELHAASSEGGRRMLTRGYRLRVGDPGVGQGIVGYVASCGEPRVALDVGEDAVYFDNPYLSQTRSEIALPLWVRDEVIGVLDVQSTEAEAFTEEDAAVLQTLADQVAVAMSNAELYQQAQASLQAERQALEAGARRTWAEMLRSRLAQGFVSDRRGVTPADGGWTPEMERALYRGETVAQDADGTVLTDIAVPIKAQGRVIGVVGGRLPDGKEWTAAQLAFAETLTAQLGLALESAQLYYDVQRRAAREQATREIADRMRSAIEMDELLQTAIRETAQVLGAHRAFVQWASATDGEATAGQGNGDGRAGG